MADGVTAEDASRLAHLLRWSGVALVAAGVLMVVAALPHPSRETAAPLSPTSRGWSRRMWFTQLLGCWCCSAFPVCMRLTAAAWGRWGWVAS
jgi:hypothetical protein